MDLAYDAAMTQLRIQLFDEGGTDVLDDILSLDLGSFGLSHVGFSGKTGGAGENHDVRSWQLSAIVP
jgi:hypothetical protein